MYIPWLDTLLGHNSIWYAKHLPYYLLLTKKKNNNASNLCYHVNIYI